MYEKAAHVFNEAHKLTPKNPTILSQYAQAIYLGNNNRLDKKASSLIQKALKISPDYPEAINLLAIDAFSNKNYQAAIEYWQKLLPALEHDTDAYHNLLAAITRAKSMIQV